VNRDFRWLCAALTAFAFTSCDARASSLATAADIRSALAAYVAAYPKAEVIVGVVDGADTAVYAANGTAAPVPNERTIFQIGSITKTFTATLLAEMVGAGEVALDDPISKYLPAGVSAPLFHGTAITLRTLAQQTSGLPRLPPNFAPRDMANPYADYTVAKLYDGLSQTHLARAPGEQYEYSNFGVMLLGQLLANRAHSSYPDLVESRILRTLRMNDSTAAGTSVSRATLAPGYATDGTMQPPWDSGSLGGAGSIESDVHDMLIYLKANLAAPAGALGAAMASAQKPRVGIGLNGVLRIGLIWMTNTDSGITFHNGETGGYHAFIGFDRAADRGAVVLANIADMDIDQLAVHVLAPYVPAPSPAAASAKEPSRYNGVYQLSPSFAITVYKSGGKLYAQGTGQQALELAPAGDHAFSVIGVDARITFDVDAKGNVTGLTLHQNGIDQRAKRAP
jgi:serine-type D-Ala-D-Ala carboxypeptidase/endopeptidase